MSVQEQVGRIPVKDALAPLLEKGSVRTCPPTPSAADFRCEGPVRCWVSQYELSADVLNLCVHADGG